MFFIFYLHGHLHEFPRAAASKHHKLSGFKKKQLIISKFWRLEVRNQDLNMAMLPLKPIMESFLSPFWWFTGNHTVPFVYNCISALIMTAYPLCVCIFNGAIFLQNTKD